MSGGMGRWEKELIEEFKKFFSLLGKSEEEIEKIFEGVSGIDLKNSPEIRRIIDEEFERKRKKEEAVRLKKEEEKLELLEKVKSLDLQIQGVETEQKKLIESAETEQKKLLEQRDEILRKLSGGET